MCLFDVEDRELGKEGQTLVEETEGGNEGPCADLEEADLAVDDDERDVLAAVLVAVKGTKKREGEGRKRKGEMSKPNRLIFTRKTLLQHLLKIVF